MNTIICPKCGEIIEEELGITWGDACPFCLTTLVNPETEAKNFGTTNLGDANAISGGIHNTDSHAVDSHDVHTTDSHNVQNVDSHNVHNETHISNTTYQERQKTGDEVIQDNRKQFRDYCATMISEDGRYSNVALRQIACKQSDLGVSDTDAAKIKEEVQKLKRAQNVSSLSTMDRIELDAAINAIKENRSSAKEKLRKLEGMIDHTTEEDAHFHYYLLLAAINPEKCIMRFENRIEEGIEDNYWLTFWASFCFERTKKDKEFNLAKSMLLSWSDMPEENEFLLSADEKAAAFYSDTTDIDDLDMAKSLLSLAKGKCSPLLEDFRRALLAVLNDNRESEGGCDFYYERFFASYVYLNPDEYPELYTNNNQVEVVPTIDSASMNQTSKSGNGKIIGVIAAVVAILVIAILLFKGKGDVKTGESILEPKTVESTEQIEATKPASTDIVETVKKDTPAASDPSAPASAQTVVTQQTQSQTSVKQSAPIPTDGTCKYGVGVYTGKVLNGKPADGKGKISYPNGGLIDSRDPQKREAQPGDYVEGFFKNGHLVQGYWYSSSEKKTIIIGE